MLFVDWICPEPDRDSGSIRTVSMLQTLLAMRAHVTFSPLDTNRHPRYAAALRYMGVEVVPLQRLTYHRVQQQGRGNGDESSSAGGKRGCRYDVMLVARRECFDAVYEALQHSCTSVPRIFDTVDLHFMREAKAADFQKAHAGDLPLLEAVFGKKAVHGDRSTAAQQVDKDRARELKYIDYSKVSGYTLTPKSAKSMGDEN